MFGDRRYFRNGDGRSRRISAEQVGGKGANLDRLRRAGFNVPPWCAVPTPVFETVKRRVGNRIAALLAGIDYDSAASIEVAAARIGELIRKSTVPPRTMRLLSRRLSTSFDGVSRFAVRSSVADEDSATDSFAGQMDSFLKVPVEGLHDAIRSVWASAYSARSLAYRHRKGIGDRPIRAAVIIQAMVNAVKAGVLFTRDPHDGNDTIVISAGRGLGEGVVQGTAEVDNYRIRAGSPLIERIPGRSGDSSAMTLSDREVRQLCRLGRDIEREFARPQDIEWAFDGHGRLHILQARPIVAPLSVGPGSDFRVWDNSNVVESYPGLTLPLTFSFVRECYEHSFRNATLGFLLDRRALAEDMHIFENMIGLIHGRVYYCLLNWYRMLSYLPGFKRHRESWDQMIGIARRTNYAANRLSPVNRAYAALMVVGRLISVRRLSRAFFRRFNRSYERFRSLDFERCNAEDLVRCYEWMRLEFMPAWHLTLYNDFCAMKYYDWLKRLCGRWLPQGGPNLHNDLLCGENGVESVRPVISLLNLAQLVGADPRLVQLFESPDDVLVWRRIQAEAAFAAFKGALERHLDEFGDRGLEELKLENLTFRESPESLIPLIRAYRRRGLSPKRLASNEHRIRETAEACMTAHLGPLQSLVFRFVLRKARRAIAARENMRFARTRLFGILRRLFRRMGRLFVQQGILRTERDIHYLTLAEIFGFVRGASVTQDLRAVAELRRYEYEGFQDAAAPGRIETRGLPYVDLALRGSPAHDYNRRLQGIGCASGVVEGTAWVVDDPSQTPPHDDCILIARSTDPGWVFLMIQSRGIVVERGSLLSHTAIVGRELGIPTVVGVEGAISSIPQGCRVRINGETGEVVCR